MKIKGEDEKGENLKRRNELKTMKSSAVWEIMASGPLKASRRFAETNRLHLQGRGVSQQPSNAVALRQIISDYFRSINFHSSKCSICLICHPGLVERAPFMAYISRVSVSSHHNPHNNNNNKLWESQKERDH
jgi:hypothetical protein